MQTQRHPHRRRAPRPTLIGAAVIATLASASASALEFDTGDSGIKLRWDNTFKYSNAFRLKDRSATLAPSAPPAVVGAINLDDADRNFGKGLISNRLDLLSEADIAYGAFGARLSVAAWFDEVYRRRNDNNSSGLLGPGSSTANSNRGFDQFTAGTRKLHGGKAEVLDAFAYGTFRTGESSTTVRLGKHALVWGESIFLGANAIAGAQNATDLIKAQSVPNSQVKELVLPVPQISMQSVITPGVSIGAYYQFRYVRNRFPGVGSYFASGADVGFDNTADFALGPAGPVPIVIPPVKDSGQGGLQVSFRLAETDFGLYALRYHSKAFQPYPVLALTPGGPAPAAFRQVSKEGIESYGASASRSFGDVNVAAEASIRRGTDLAVTRFSDARALLPFPTPPYDNRDNPGYAIGNTGHINVSTLWTLPRTPLWQDAILIAEVAWNRLLSCTKNCDTLTGTGTRDAAQIAAVLTPTYYQVLPGLNLSVPIGVFYTPKGSRSLALGAGPSGPEDGGVANIGVQGVYLDAWRFGLTYTHFFGRAATFTSGSGAPGDPVAFTYRQSLRDRDFLSFSLARTF